MKRGDLRRWTNTGGCVNLLFFSQLVNELLFDYSIPSNRVSTLNSHFLCLDAQSIVDSVERHGIPEGTLKPVMEELYSEIKKDPVFSTRDDTPLDYFVKYQSEKYVPVGRVSEMNYSDLAKTSRSIATRFFTGNSYYESLKSMIINIVLRNDTTEQQTLFRLVKSLLTELMNAGYTLRYIYSIMNKLFWNSSVDINTPENIHQFFSAFDFTEKEYEVVFKVNRKRMEKFVSYIDDMDFVEAMDERFSSHDERHFFMKKNWESFICIKYNALDPFDAADSVKDLLSTNAALYRLYDHDYRYNIKTIPCMVYGEKWFYIIGRSVGAVEHTRSLSSNQISSSLNMANKALKSITKSRSIDDLLAILNAARFHSHSLDSISEENQLLDLWSIFESVLDISNKHTSDRIQQICMYLVPILKQRYVYSLFEQLASDIKNFNEIFYAELTGEDSITSCGVRKICEFILLDEFEEKRRDFVQETRDFPLLAERIQYYTSTLSDTEAVFKFVEKHSERVRWQVMRIYRNRNLIIHNGKSMPYLHLLIENLHSYVDDFLAYAIRRMSEGHDIESMCQELFVKECRWNSKFQRNKRPLDRDLLSLMLAL